MTPKEIRAWRLRRGLKQREAAQKIGVTEWTFGQWERGHNQPPEMAIKLMRAMDREDSWRDLEDAARFIADYASMVEKGGA